MKKQYEDRYDGGFDYEGRTIKFIVKDDDHFKEIAKKDGTKELSRRIEFYEDGEFLDIVTICYDIPRAYNISPADASEEFIRFDVYKKLKKK